MKPTNGNPKCQHCEGMGFLADESPEKGIRAAVCPECYSGHEVYVEQMLYFMVFEWIGTFSEQAANNGPMVLNPEEYYIH